jgi:hypothetical protein
MKRPAARQDYIENIRLVKDRTAPLTIVFEPWHSTFEIPPGEHVIVSSRGPIGDGVEITIGDGNWTLWGWPGSATVVVHRGEVVIDWRELSVPSTPVSSLREMGEKLWANVKEVDVEDSDAH